MDETTENVTLLDDGLPDYVVRTKGILTELTPAQEAHMLRVRERFIKRGLATGRVDRDAVVAAAKESYELAGLPFPGDDIRWFDSPMAAAKAVKAEGIDPMSTACYGQGDAWVSFYQFFRELRIEGHEQLDCIEGLYKMTQSGWWWPMDTAVFLCERPESLHIDAEGRPHNQTGPAVTYFDGNKLYFWHGVSIPDDLFERRNTITATEVLAIQNAEVRRAMQSIMGEARFLDGIGAKVVEENSWGKLYRAETVQGETEPVVILRLVNSSPERSAPLPGKEDVATEMKGVLVLLDLDSRPLKIAKTMAVEAGPEYDGVRAQVAAHHAEVQRLASEAFGLDGMEVDIVNGLPHKVYWFRVPPDQTTVVGALAWKYRVPVEVYKRLKVQT